MGVETYNDLVGFNSSKQCDSHSLHWFVKPVGPPLDPRDKRIGTTHVVQRCNNTRESRVYIRMFRNNHNDYDEFHSVRSGPTLYDDGHPGEDYTGNTVRTTHNHSSDDNIEKGSRYDEDYSRAEATPYDNDQQYDERTSYSYPNHDDERSTYYPNHSVQEEEGSFIRPSAYNDEMYDADEVMDADLSTADHRQNTYEPGEYDSNRPYSNDERYRDNPYDDEDEDADAEQDALYRTDKYKPSLEQRKRKCCNVCYVPSCEYRGPWYVWMNCVESCKKIGFEDPTHLTSLFQ
jgi:hypothetical protein